MEFLMKYLPQVYLLLQIKDAQYVSEVLEKIDSGTLEQYSNRIIIVGKDMEIPAHTKVKNRLKACFPGFDEKKQLMKLKSD